MKSLPLYPLNGWWEGGSWVPIFSIIMSDTFPEYFIGISPLVQKI